MKNQRAFWSAKQRSRSSQKGIAAVVVTVGMVALLAVTGMALDTGHLLLNKTRVQNATDAAALAAARSLQNNSGNMVLARSTANTVFNNNLSGELSEQTPSITVTFSENLNPGSFANSVTSPSYVKVATNTIPLNSFLIRLAGFNNKQVTATAVAGFANGANFCGMIPVMVCEGPDSGPNGYDLGEEYVLKFGSESGPDPEIGSGNFHLIDLPGLQGANDIRYAFAGNESCSGMGESEPIDVSPGNKVGPTVQGINTRFGLYEGPFNSLSDRTTYPPDYANDDQFSPDQACTESGCFDYDDYLNFYSNNNAVISASDKRFQRRIVTVPIGNCATATTTGNNTNMVVTGLACFLLTEPAVQASTPNDDSSEGGALRGAFTDACNPPGVGISTANGPDIIVLYKNPDGDDT